MKVKDLVKILLECNQDLNVYCDVAYESGTEPVRSVEQGRHELDDLEVIYISSYSGEEN